MQPSLKTSCSRLGFALFSFMLFWNITATLLTGFVAHFAPQWYAGSWALLLINDISLYCMSLPLFLYISSRIPSYRPPKTKAQSLHPLQYLLLFLLCLGIMYGVGFLTEMFFSFMERIFDFKYTNSLNTFVDGAHWLSLLLLGVVVPSIGEELIFRYVFYKKLAVYGDKIYIIFSALCFGLFHINPSQIIYAFLLGLLLAGSYVRTGRLWVPISLHFLLNTFGLLLVPNLMTQSELFSLVFSISLVCLFPISLFFLFVLYRKLPKSYTAPAFTAEAGHNKQKPFAQQCIANIGMFLYLTLVLLLLALNLWAL